MTKTQASNYTFTVGGSILHKCKHVHAHSYSYSRHVAAALLHWSELVEPSELHRLLPWTRNLKVSLHTTLHELMYSCILWVTPIIRLSLYLVLVYFITDLSVLMRIKRRRLADSIDDTVTNHGTRMTGTPSSLSMFVQSALKHTPSECRPSESRRRSGSSISSRNKKQKIGMNILCMSMYSIYTACTDCKSCQSHSHHSIEHTEKNIAKKLIELYPSPPHAHTHITCINYLQT